MVQLIEALEQTMDIEHKLGLPLNFLGMECYWGPDTVTLFQKRAINRLCEEYRITYGASTPISPTDDLSKRKPQEEKIELKPYQRLIGGLMYIGQTTRPDILYATSYLARRNTDATSRHWEGALRVLRYLFKTSEHGHHVGSGKGITIWVDASYGGEDGRCQMGTVTCIGNTAIGWTSQRQPVVALSSTEAEYIAISAGAQQATWMRGFLKELGEEIKPVIITDNEGAKKLSENPGFHKRTKHIDQRYHYIRQQLQLGELSIEWKAGKYNKADLLTKALPAPKLDRAREIVMIGKTVLKEGEHVKAVGALSKGE
jgi:hypothetical protein